MSYIHLTLIERGKPEGFLVLKMSIREIAKLMERYHSTIAGEIPYSVIALVIGIGKIYMR